MEDFSKQVKSWVQLDNRAKELNVELKEIRDRKKDVQGDIINYVQTMERVPKIEITDGFLSFVETKTYTTLTFGFLKTCLLKRFSEEEAEELVEFIKSERKVTVEKEMRRS
jgi:hypothetical protein